jgi:hypothetical protein
MDTTIRDPDERAYRELRARAVLQGRDVGNLLNQGIRAYLAQLPGPRETLHDLKPEPFPDGNERLSEQIDEVLYGEPKP